MRCELKALHYAIIVSKGFESQYAVKTPSEQIHNIRLADDKPFILQICPNKTILAIC